MARPVSTGSNPSQYPVAVGEKYSGEYDGYIYDHLLWHLDKAEWKHEFENLLREEDDRGL